MNAQIIKQDGKDAFAVIPIDEYRALLETVEDAEDIAEINAIHAALDRGDEELIPGDMVERLANESPLKVWREHRKLSQKALAEATGVSQAYIAMIEKGEREGKVGVLSAIAGVLNVTIDDLV